MNTLSHDEQMQRINEGVEALRARMTRRFIDVDEAFAQLAAELHWQTDQAAWGLRRARRQLSNQLRTAR
ncbi:hypothetical protein [Corynebacterium terpenotabidum]|uniref:Uncharacterized protein n=1 Tax=Corynebacterium terpenotabidum Y-11 TaxID=1200352 RepID=S4XH53_9CORY|nr:hypothetical protein [Corynebacterium terpenotabidum]AGP31881.1 hypothetical protein A606_11210 [Corynebacterium terpenotabidum Y-11]